MAMLIRSDLDLPTLRIMLDPQRMNFTEVVFQVVRGQREPREVARCSLRDLGLPAALVGMRPVDDRALTVPPGVLGKLRDAVPGLGSSPLPPDSALWLEFPSPRGFLYVVPWERLLERLERSLFRLPNHLVRPQAPGKTLDVAICASAPAAEGKDYFPADSIIRPLALQYLGRTGHEVTVHVFTDDETYSARPLVDLGPRVVVHDPAASIRYGSPARSATVGTTAQVSNPWLQWVRDAIGDRALDFVHFVGHGYLSGDRGAIAVAAAPTDNRDLEWSRFIGAVELNTFLSQVGAWGLVLTGPPNNYSEAGLRELADSIAMLRPGVTMTHDFGADGDCAQLGLALQTVLAPASPLDHPLPAATCWVHPRFVEFPEEYRVDLSLDVDGSSIFVTGATKNALAGNTTQAWVAAASRVLEVQQIRWLPDSSGRIADPAALIALQNVADLVERHVRRAHPLGDIGGGDA